MTFIEITFYKGIQRAFLLRTTFVLDDSETTFWNDLYSDMDGKNLYDLYSDTFSEWACASAPGPNERLPFIDAI